MLTRNAKIHIAWLHDAESLNPALVKAFIERQHDPDNRQTHFYAGRYENTYMDAAKLPGVERILAFAKTCAAEILNKREDELKLGFWLNAMQPGQRTLPHRHDDADEWLSGVYYLQVPYNSGELVLSDEVGMTEISPEEGKMVFFDPSTEHEVTLHEGEGMRLSLAVNVGPVDSVNES